MGQRTCEVEDCSRKYKGRGLCNMHYQRLKSGKPLADPPRASWFGQTCTADGCDREIVAKGFCSPHWQRQHQGNESAEPIKSRNEGNPCAVDDCERPTRKRGWCSMHYERWSKHGDPLIDKTPVKGTCSRKDCDRPHYARGGCLIHYRRDLLGIPDTKPIRPFRGGTCSADGCGGHARHRGLCRLHRQRADYQQNPARFKTKTANRRLLLGAIDAEQREISEEYRQAIANDPCYYCGATEATHTDHYFPVVLGGTDHWWNLVQACASCNLTKHAKCGTRFLLRQGVSVAPRLAAVA